MKMRVEGDRIILEINVSEGTRESSSGKMDIFADLPRGWTNLGPDASGRDVIISINMGYHVKSRP